MVISATEAILRKNHESLWIMENNISQTKETSHKIMEKKWVTCKGSKVIFKLMDGFSSPWVFRHSQYA